MSTHKISCDTIGCLLRSYFFHGEISENKCRLERDRAYYAQVQGQMGITGAKWCDFIVYTSKGLYVERIAFDAVFWQDLRSKVLDYYF